MGDNTTAAGAADRMFLFIQLFVESLWGAMHVLWDLLGRH